VVSCSQPPVTGTWSGPGITNAAAGTFSPAVAGVGVHTITYTLSCGKAVTTQISVSTCAAITVCKEANGNFTASGGVTGMYKRQRQVSTQDCSTCLPGIPPFIQPCSQPAGCAKTVLVWQNFASGTTGTPTGTYPVRVVHTVGAELIITSLASVPACNPCPVITVTNSAKQNVTCIAPNSGAATVAATGGTVPYAYAWSGGAGNNAAANNLSAGTYTVTATDANLCTGTTTVTITAPAPPTLTFSNKVEPGCGQANGSVSATLGGTAPFQVTINNGSTQTTQTVPVATTAPLTNLAAGTYTIVITDAVSCSATQTITFTPPAAPVINSVTATPTACRGGNDGTATVSATGGASPLGYAWSGSSQATTTISGLAAGNYVVTVTDAAGCKDTGSVAVVDGPVCCSLSLSVTTVQPACGQSNGSIAITPTPAATYSYMWSGGLPATATQSNLAGGQYHVTVTNTAVANCTKDTIITLTNPNGPALTFSNKVEPGCGQSNGSVSATLAGGTAPYQVTIDNGSTQTTQTVPFATTAPLSNLPAGNYTISVSDAASCSATQTITFTEPAGPSISSVTSTPTTCRGGSDGTATVSAAGGTGSLGYAWSGSSQVTTTINALAAGNYIVTVTDAAGCKDTGAVAVADGPVCCAIGIAAVLAQPGCGLSNGGIVLTVTGSGNYTFAWSNSTGAKDLANVPAGNYRVTVTDVIQGCSEDTVFSLSNQNGPVVNNITISDATCAGNDGSISVYATSANGLDAITAYSWSNTTTDIDSFQNSLTAGTYSFTVTDPASCIATGTATVGAAVNCCGLQVTATSTGPGCGASDAGIQVTVAAAGTAPYRFSIDGSVYQPGTAFSNLAAGTYTVYAGDATGCSDTITVTIAPVNNTISLSLQSTDPGCSGLADGTVTALVSGGSGAVGFNWSNNAGNVTAQSNLAAGTYVVTVTDGAGCSQTASAVLNAAQPIAIALNDTIICQGESSVLSAPAGFAAYVWSGGETSQSITVDTTNTYSVTVSDANGCSATGDASVTVVQKPVIAMVTDTTIFENNDIMLAPVISGSTAGAEYLWQPDTDLSCNNCANPVASPGDTVTYLLTYTSAQNCRASASITINIESGTNLFIPNIFSPDGDGNNDILLPYAIGLKAIKWSVFNRWGELVFRSTNVHQGWDGNFNGLMQPPGIYVYIVELTFRNNKTKMFKGGLTLIR
jgi:gliding motility-associated-like protein